MTDAAAFAEPSRDRDAGSEGARFYGQAPEDTLARRAVAGDGIASALSDLSDEIEARPEIAAGIAAVLGLVLGLALGRPSRAIVYIKD